ncbi:hypothetical protein SAMN05216255_3607 [Pseudomonas segetis]|uniref:Uncharacterized protein n=1 Tax=Pseudomonas segetis TaxID=298908 RepID=A0A239HVJ2_9PSED|nr:hypothetical protein SAMN05216255_3607 [Pseudomonas segetis]
MADSYRSQPAKLRAYGLSQRWPPRLQKLRERREYTNIEG